MNLDASLIFHITGDNHLGRLMSVFGYHRVPHYQSIQPLAYFLD